MSIHQFWRLTYCHFLFDQINFDKIFFVKLLYLNIFFELILKMITWFNACFIHMMFSYTAVHVDWYSKNNQRKRCLIKFIHRFFTNVKKNIFIWIENVIKDIEKNDLFLIRI